MMILSIKTCFALICRDMMIFREGFVDRCINGLIWVVLNTLVFQYIFIQMGMAVDYGPFMVCANIMSWGFFEVMENVSRLISDLQSDSSLTYDMTLPLPHWLIFTRMALSNALQAMSIGFFILPVSKLILWHEFNLSQVSWCGFILIFIIGHIFYGFFSLWLASMVKNMHAIGNIWTRVVFPLWWLGGYQFSWKTLRTFSPIVANIALCNPITYCFEGIRAVILGQDGYIGWGYCFMVLTAFTVAVGYIGTKKMMRRLDCL